MANSTRTTGKAGASASPPESFANVPAPAPAPSLDHSFTLQMMLDVQKSVATLTERTERLIKDVEKQSTKIDQLKTDASFAKGASWIIGTLLAALWATILLFLGKITGFKTIF